MKRKFSVEQILSVHMQAEVGVPLTKLIRKASIRETQFPDTWVIIPCSIRIWNCEKC
jgi:hypothetical protein